MPLVVAVHVATTRGRRTGSFDLLRGYHGSRAGGRLLTRRVASLYVAFEPLAGYGNGGWRREVDLLGTHGGARAHHRGGLPGDLVSHLVTPDSIHATRDVLRHPGHGTNVIGGSGHTRVVVRPPAITLQIT